MIETGFDKLTKVFRQKVSVFLKVVKEKYPNVYPFETFRSRARQARLYANNKKKGPVAVPGSSYHEKGMAVDRVFLNKKGQPTRIGDYKYLHYIGKMCGVIPVTGESCHLQDNKSAIGVAMLANSALWKKSKSSAEQKLLSRVNAEFRLLGYK